MKNKLSFMAIMLLIIIFAGCGKSDAQTAEPEQEEEAVQDPEEAAEQEESGQGFSFADVADREFYFSSGAGAWRTVLYIHGDGSFDGFYSDSDMGDAGEEYPNGTLYYSEFSGKFTEPERVDSTTYTFRIDSLEYVYDFGDEIRDGFHFYYTEAYGLAGAEDLYMYLPGAKLEDLPEQYRNWVGYYDLDAVSVTELAFYGLYNAEQETGFSSYSYEEPDAALQIESVISETEDAVIALEAELQSAQSQGDMNVISGEIYTAWDNCLNTVWGILKENLDEESMNRLTEEEREWISEKEAAVQEAGEEVEGGSMYSMVVNGKAAELTKERVYELAEYIKE